MIASKVLMFLIIDPTQGVSLSVWNSRWAVTGRDSESQVICTGQRDCGTAIGRSRSEASSQMTHWFIVIVRDVVAAHWLVHRT